MLYQVLYIPTILNVQHTKQLRSCAKLEAFYVVKYIFFPTLRQRTNPLSSRDWRPFHRSWKRCWWSWVAELWRKMMKMNSQRASPEILLFITLTLVSDIQHLYFELEHFKEYSSSCYWALQCNNSIVELKHVYLFITIKQFWAGCSSDTNLNM